MTSVRDILKFFGTRELPTAAVSEREKDRKGLPLADPGIDAVVAANLAWLTRAQDSSRSRDGGVARHYSLLDGWSNSYPETTGYIVSTMLRCAELRNEPDLRERARRMLDWLVSIQFPEGGFQAGVVGASPNIPVTFNTGQILLGLADGVRTFDAYHDATRRAADWLVSTQDPDGCWRRHSTPFARPGEKVYETHVAWGLLEAARVLPDRGYSDAALRNVRWALLHQHENGWFDKCCLDRPRTPLTHTLGYLLRGLVEAWRFSRDPALLEGSRRTADALLDAVSADGRLPGRLTAHWTPAARWVCLTGSAQIAACWLLLYKDTSDRRYVDAARDVNRFVRRTVLTNGDPNVRGGVKGSFPVDGAYGRFEYLNWACKFCIDAQILEEECSGS